MPPIWLYFSSWLTGRGMAGIRQRFRYHKAFEKELLWYVCLGTPFQIDFSYWDQQQEVTLFIEKGQYLSVLWSCVQPGVAMSLVQVVGRGSFESRDVVDSPVGCHLMNRLCSSPREAGVLLPLVGCLNEERINCYSISNLYDRTIFHWTIFVSDLVSCRENDLSETLMAYFPQQQGRITELVVWRWPKMMYSPLQLKSWHRGPLVSLRNLVVKQPLLYSTKVILKWKHMKL